jgi:hypothetical protein
MVKYSKIEIKKLAKHFGPHILRTALAIRHMTSDGKKKKLSAQERRLMYSYLMPEFAVAITETFDSRSQIKRLLENESIRWSFIEFIVAIELINVCNGKKPSGEFIKVFKDCIPEKGMSNRSFLYHLATLLYLDDKNKLFKAVIKHPLFPYLGARNIVKIALHTVSNERYANRARLDSDSVKIKGAVKTAKIIPNERGVSSEDGHDYIIEEAFEPTENFYKKLFQDKLAKKLRNDLARHIQKSNRTDRAENTIALIDYVLASKEKKINLTKAAIALSISRKTLHKIRKTIQDDPGFKRLLDAFHQNNQ